MPPVELSPEEQVKFDAVLKERGFDNHAQEVIARTNAEAKTMREAKEKLEREHAETRTKLTELETKQKAFDDKAAEEAAKVKKAEEDAANAKKSLDERLADFETKFAARLEERDKAATKERDALVAKIEARDARILKTNVRRIAEREGIIDSDLVEFIDLKDVKIEDGEPDIDQIEEIVKKHAEAKPHLYKARRNDRDANTRVDRPALPERNTRGSGKDFANMSDEEFEREEAKLRAARN